MSCPDNKYSHDLLLKGVLSTLAVISVTSCNHTKQMHFLTFCYEVGSIIRTLITIAMSTISNGTFPDVLSTPIGSFLLCDTIPFFDL